jgi:hypothetical protein
MSIVQNNAVTESQEKCISFSFNELDDLKRHFTCYYLLGFIRNLF